MDKVIVKQFLELLLPEQYVSCDEACTILYWYVVRGSGMGMPASGAVAEAACACNLEARLHDMAQYSVKLWFRYRDEGIASYTDANLLRAFFSTLKRRADYCCLDVEALPSNMVPFLNLEIHIDEEQYRAKTLFQKDVIAGPPGGTERTPPKYA